MNRLAARLRPLSIVVPLVVTGCGGGASSGLDSTAAGTRQSATTPAPPPTAAPPAGRTFTNPLLPSGPDPYVVRENGVYYYTQTSGDRIELWSTPAMSRLGEARHVTIFVPPATGANSRDLWAPELHRLDGRWYVYYAAGDGSRSSNDPYSSQRMFVLENDGADPMQGTWTDRGRLRSADPDAWAIDGTVFEYGGARYFFWSGRESASDGDQHLYVARMLNPWTLAAGRVRISDPDRPWERTGRVGVNEGPQVLSNASGGVFLVYSANGCWTDDYALGMLALRPGGDPLTRENWTKVDRPVLRTSPGARAYGPGHNSFFKSPDGTQDWMIYHANSSPGEGCGDARSPRMQRITWRDDGTPEFGSPSPIGVQTIVPSGDE